MNLRHIRMLFLILCCSLFVVGDLFAAASVGVTVRQPSGSASRDFSNKFLKTVMYSPCVAENTVFGAVGGATGITVNNFFDQFEIRVNATNEDVNQDGTYEYDLYFFIVHVSATGTAATVADGQFYVFRRYGALEAGAAAPALNGLQLVVRATAAEIEVGPDKYLRNEDFSIVSVDERVMGGNIPFDGVGLPHGTWMAVAILADGGDETGVGATVNFQDPKTWAKWDAGYFVLGTPWRTTAPVLTCD